MWEAINTATVDSSIRVKHWSAWTAHCALYGNTADPDNPDIDKLLTFAVAMREGKYGLGALVKVPSAVEKVLGHVAQKLILNRHADPRK